MRVLIRVAALILAAACGLSAAPPSLSVTHRARALHPGELVVLTVDATAPLTSLRARAFDRDVVTMKLGASGQPADSTVETWQVLLGIDIDVTPDTYLVEFDAQAASGTAHATYPLTVESKAFPTRRLTVDPDFVNPPASAAARIAEESRLMRALFDAPPRLLEPPVLHFARPVTHEANSAFGTRSIFNGEPRGAHTGADFLSPAGTPIKAPAAGVVVLARDLYFSGNAVILDHGLGVFSLLAHLSRIDVQEGAVVEPGTVVGLVGRTGRVTGAHLHWTTRVGAARVDPLSVLELLPAR